LSDHSQAKTTATNEESAGGDQTYGASKEDNGELPVIIIIIQEFI